jgi:hypothetical protein
MAKGQEATAQELQDTAGKLRKAKDTLANLKLAVRKAKDTLANLKLAEWTEAGIKREVTDYIKEVMPAEVQGQMLAALKNAKTDADLIEIMDRVDKVSEATNQKKLRSKILKELGRAGTRQVSGKPVGKYTAEVQAQLDQIEGYLLANNKQALKELAASDLQRVLDRIHELRTGGRQARIEAEVKRKEALEATRTSIVDELTGGKGLKPGAESLPAKALEAKTGPQEALFNRQYSPGDLFDKLGKFTPGDPNQGTLAKFANDKVAASREVESRGRQLYFGKLQEGVKQIFNVKTPSQMNDLLRTLGKEEIELGTFKNAVGEDVKLTLTKGQIIKKVMEFSDPSLARTFSDGMHWTPKMKDALVNSLSGQELAFADYLMTFLQDYYPGINEVYSRINNVDLPHNNFYSPIKREHETDIVDDLFGAQGMERFAGVAPGSLKSRVANIQPLKFTDALDTVMTHVIQMEHYKAWAENLRDLRSVFGDKDVKAAVFQYHGRDMQGEIDNALNAFARGGVDPVHIVKTLDKIRANFTTSIIGLKPGIALQQLPTIMSYLTEMSLSDFIGGVNDFWLHPVENFKWMMENSPYIKERYTAGFERDMAAAKSQDIYQRITGKANFRDALFFLMNAGDKFAVVQGWWAKYQAGLKVGLSQTDAMLEANMATDRTQNTSAIETLSSLQRGGSGWKLVTMFQNQPNKYFRIIANNARNFQYGRGSRFNAAKNIAIAWVVLPVIFQLIADGFRFRKDRQLRAVLLGPINDILVVGQIVENIADWWAGEKFEYQPTPVQSIIKDLELFGDKVIRLWNTHQDPYQDIELEDVIAVIELLAKGAGEITGVPTPYLIQVEKALRSGDLRQLVFSKWALEEPKPDLPTRAAKQATELGRPIIDENAPLSNEAPDIYDMRKLNSDYNETFKKTLPEDVIKGKFDPMAVSWAEKELSRSVYETMPNQPLYKGVTPDENTGDTYVQYYRQWQARLKITSLDKLNDFDKLYPRAYLGNLTREQYALLQEYDGLDKAGKVKFLEAHPELKDNPRDEWLLAHPEDNARLAVWGQAKLLSQEAYDSAVKTVDKLNIPADALGKYLPPKEIATDYFAYNIAADKFGAMSAEARLVRANNPELTNYLGLEPVDTPIPSLELTVKWRDVQDRYDAMADKDSPFYLESIPDKKDPDYKKGREYSRDLLKQNVAGWVEDLDRIQAYNNGASGQVVEDWVEHGKLSRQFSPSSAEVKLFLVDHSQMFQWALKEEILTDDGRNWNVPVLRIDVKWKKLDDEYDSYGQWDSPAYIEDKTARAQARDVLLKLNPNYKLDRIRRNAYQEKLTGTLFDKYLSYFQLPETGQYRDNFRLKNPDFDEWLIKVKGYAPLPKSVFKAPGKTATVVSGVGEVPVLGQSELDKALADLQSRLTALS